METLIDSPTTLTPHQPTPRPHWIQTTGKGRQSAIVDWDGEDCYCSIAGWRDVGRLDVAASVRNGPASSTGAEMLPARCQEHLEIYVTWLMVGRDALSPGDISLVRLLLYPRLFSSDILRHNLASRVLKEISERYQEGLRCT